MDSAILIGRDDERRLLHGLMRQKKNVLIVGAEGVGKSLLVEDAIAAGAVKNFLHSRSSTTLKETLVNLVGSASSGKDLQKKNILTLKKSCYRLLDNDPEYVVLDQVGWVEPKFYGFLTYMKERNIPFVIAARQSGKKNVGHLWMGLYDYEILQIKNLDQAKTAQLVDHYAAMFDLSMEAEPSFKKDVFRFSEGNPKIVKEICRLAADEKYHVRGYIDVNLVDLDRRINLSMTGISLHSDHSR